MLPNLQVDHCYSFLTKFQSFVVRDENRQRDRTVSESVVNGDRFLTASRSLHGSLPNIPAV